MSTSTSREFSPETVTRIAQHAVESLVFPEDLPPIIQHQIKEATAHNVAVFAPSFAAVAIPETRRQVFDEVIATLKDVDLDTQIIVTQMRDAEGK